MIFSTEPAHIVFPVDELVIRKQVLSYLSEYFMADEDLVDETFLIDDLGADSLDLLQVVYTLNEMFIIQIEPDDLPRMLFVGGVCDLVIELVKKSDGY
ncbi:phosphopantetheine-binding protein [Glaciimonas sp. GNP009]